MLPSFLCRAEGLRRAWLAGCVAAALGCHDPSDDRLPVYPARGSISFRGGPAPGAFVTLHPKTPLGEDVPAPRANVAKDGTFKLSTFNGGDGAPEGEYVVTVRWYKLVKNGPDIVSGPNVIPARYTRPESSNIVVRIAAGENNLQPITL